MSLLAMALIGEHIVATENQGLAHLECGWCGAVKEFPYAGVPQDSVLAAAAWVKEHRHNGLGNDANNG